MLYKNDLSLFKGCPESDSQFHSSQNDLKKKGGGGGLKAQNLSVVFQFHPYIKPSFPKLGHLSLLKVKFLKLARIALCFHQMLETLLYKW